MNAIDLYRKLSRPDSNYFECQLPILAQTEKAICFDADGGRLNSKNKPVWIPKSQIVAVDFGKNDGGFRYFVKNWLYRKLV